MTVYLGADHRGFALKEEVRTYLTEKGYTVDDMGAVALNPEDDYVDFARTVSLRVSQHPENRGILLCGSGIGVDITANKGIGIRCGLGYTEEQISAARKDDDINILALAADFVELDQVHRIVTAFLETPFSGEERHRRRLAKIEEIERTHE